MGPACHRAPKPFHTVDAVHGTGPFCDSAWPSGQRETLLDLLAGLISKTWNFAVIASMTQRDHKAYVAGSAPGASIASPYLLCLSSCLEMVGNLLTDREETINYWFEQGDENELEAREFMARVNRQAELTSRFHIGRYGFADKRTVIPLHAGDFVAYEWQKNYKNIVSHKQERWTHRMKILRKEKSRIYVRHLGPIGIGMQDMLNTIYQSD